MSETPKPKSNGAAYVCVYPMLRDLARECGYALAVHGSLVRDFDVVAIPWTDGATSPEELVAHIMKFADVRVLEHDKPTVPRRLSHGRLAWPLHFGSGPYVDLSIMPRNSPVGMNHRGTNRKRERK